MSSRCSVVFTLVCAVIGLLFGAALAGRAGASTLYVASTSTARVPDGASWATAFPSLSPALQAARPGDEVWVAFGRYRGNYRLSSGVRLYGGFHGDETDREARDWQQHEAVLLGGGKGPVVTIEGGPSPYPTALDGFTIRDGSGEETDGKRLGGGVLVTGPVDALIAHNRIIYNAVHAREFFPVADGGGIGLMQGASARIKDNLIAHNSATRNGGGIAVWGASTVDIANNTVVYNDAADGGGVAFGKDTVKFRNNIVAFNTSGLYCPRELPPPDISYQLLYGNKGYQCSWGDHFVDTPTVVLHNPEFVDTRQDNYRLAASSPARNAGTDEAVRPNEQDLFGRARLIGAAVDIGAAEARPSAVALDVPVVHVDPGSQRASDSNDGRTWKNPKRTLQAGIDAAREDGGEVWATGGAGPIYVPRGVHVYGGFSGTETRRNQRQGLLSLSGKAEGRDALVMLSSGSVLDGFAFSGGPAVACGDGAPTIKACQFRDSDTAALTAEGGSPRVLNSAFQGNVTAMRFTGGSPRVVGNRILGNAGDEDKDGEARAGGVVLSHASALIAQNLFAGNVGGAVSMDTCAVDVFNNTFVANRGFANYVDRSGEVGALAGAVESRKSALTFENNIVAGNTGGVQDTHPLAGFPVVRNNCAWQNAGFDWSLQRLPDPTGRDGNLRTDPMLVAPERGNFHIQLRSPCRNAGDDAIVQRHERDIDQQPRRMGRRVDIGADENETTLWREPPVIIRVQETPGNGANDGTSWKRPMRSLDAAVKAAAMTGGEVWVAKGSYRRSIVLPGFVAVYGGFAGGETRRDQRDPAKNPTVLEGGGEGTVVSVPRGAMYTVIDGFTIRGGAGLSAVLAGGTGAAGGIACWPGSSTTIANCHLTGNAGGDGHAVSVERAWLAMANSVLTRNGNDGKGKDAAVLFHRSLGTVEESTIEDNDATGLAALARSSVNIRHNAIRANRGDAGGILISDSMGEIANNAIAGNAAGRMGGGIALEYTAVSVHDNVISANTSAEVGGGLASLSGNPLVVNNTFLRNTAVKDGGAASMHAAGMLYNNIFAHNSSGVAGNEILVARDKPTLIMRRNCFFGNAAYQTKDLPETEAIRDNVSVDPLFDHRPGEEFRLTSRSPCIDSGLDVFATAADRDIDGQPRLMGRGIDLGADEYRPTPAPTGTTVRRPVRTTIRATPRTTTP